MDKKKENQIHSFNVWITLTNKQLKKLDEYREAQTQEKWESLNTRPSHRRGLITRNKIIQEMFIKGLEATLKEQNQK